MISIRMKLQIKIDGSVSIMSRWICGMDNVQMLLIRCQQVLKKMMILVCKSHNKIHLQALGDIHGWGTTFGCLTVKGLN